MREMSWTKSSRRSSHLPVSLLRNRPVCSPGLRKAACQYPMLTPSEHVRRMRDTLEHLGEVWAGMHLCKL
jgi:hypothetical protein